MLDEKLTLLYRVTCLVQWSAAMIGLFSTEEQKETVSVNKQHPVHRAESKWPACQEAAQVNARYRLTFTIPTLYSTVNDNIEYMHFVCNISLTSVFSFQSFSATLSGNGKDDHFHNGLGREIVKQAMTRTLHDDFQHIVVHLLLIEMVCQFLALCCTERLSSGKVTASKWSATRPAMPDS